MLAQRDFFFHKTHKELCGAHFRSVPLDEISQYEHPFSLSYVHSGSFVLGNGTLSSSSEPL